MKKQHANQLRDKLKFNIEKAMLKLTNNRLSNVEAVKKESESIRLSKLVIEEKSMRSNRAITQQIKGTSKLLKNWGFSNINQQKYIRINKKRILKEKKIKEKEEKKIKSLKEEELKLMKKLKSNQLQYDKELSKMKNELENKSSVYEKYKEQIKQLQRTTSVGYASHPKRLTLHNLTVKSSNLYLK